MIRLALALLLFCGCGKNVGDRVVIEGGVSMCSPAEWTVDKKKDNGATIIEGEGGRLSVIVLDTPALGRDPGNLMDTLKAMSPGLSVVEQADFDVDGGQGKEFIVSCLEEGRKQDGVVYLIGRNKKLCVLTFVVRGDSLAKRLDLFRESARTLKFSETY